MIMIIDSDRGNTVIGLTNIFKNVYWKKEIFFFNTPDNMKNIKIIAFVTLIFWNKDCGGK